MIKFILVFVAAAYAVVAQRFPEAAPNCTATRTTNCSLKAGLPLTHLGACSG